MIDGVILESGILNWVPINQTCYDSFFNVTLRNSGVIRWWENLHFLFREATNSAVHSNIVYGKFMVFSVRCVFHTELIIYVVYSHENPLNTEKWYWVETGNWKLKTNSHFSSFFVLSFFLAWNNIRLCTATRKNVIRYGNLNWKNFYV